MLVAASQVHPVCSLAASYRSEANPIGEQMYSAHFLTRLLPIGIIAGGLLLAWLLAKIRSRKKRLLVR